MKWWQYYFLMSAIYVSRYASQAVCLSLGAAFTVLGFIAMWRKE